MKMRLYKIWRTGLGLDGQSMLIWAEDADEAFFKIARKIDPKVVSCQWTGAEEEWDSEDAKDRIKQSYPVLDKEAYNA